MDYTKFDIKQIDFLINKEIDKVSATQQRNTTASNQFHIEFIKGLTWGDARLSSTCQNSFINKHSHSFNTSSPLATGDFKMQYSPDTNNGTGGGFLHRSFTDYQLTTDKQDHGTIEADKLSYIGALNNAERLNRSFPSTGELYSSFSKPDLNTSNQFNRSFGAAAYNSSNQSFESPDYKSACTSFQANNSFQNLSSPNLYNSLNQSYNGQVVKRQIYQMSEECDPIISFDSDLPKASNLPPTADKIWEKLGVTSEILATWTERLRKYLVQTVFVRVVNEIDLINALLKSTCRDDVAIGETSLATIKLLCETRSGQTFDRIKEVLPFLEAHQNQQYLLERIRALGFGCMSAYVWQLNGETDAIKIDKNIPNDTTIVMHFLCSYLNSRLPQSCLLLDAKTFTRRHFIPFGDKIKPDDYSNSVAFVEESLNPPHFNVISNGQIFIMKKGPSNVFHAILFFFYCIKINHNGLLRQIKIGPSGLNLLWIFED